MKLKTLKKGQGTLEYAVIIVVVIGALIAMQWYIKGGYQGRLRSASDDMGEQFSPTMTAMNYTTKIKDSSTTEVTGGGNQSLKQGGASTTTVYNQNQTRFGSENTTGLTPVAGQQR